LFRKCTTVVHKVYHALIFIAYYLRVGSPFTLPFLEAPSTTMTLRPHSHKSRLLIRVKELLVSHPKGWREKNALSVIALDIFKLIVPIERPLPLGK